jgi:tetratricopeptide (TPR) repeat protein
MTYLRLLLPAFLLTACASHSAIEQSKVFARLNDRQHEFEVLDDARNEQLAAGGTVDPELEAAHASALKRYLRWRALQNIFEEREEEALIDLAELETLDPAYPGLQDLRQRADLKRAKRACIRGDEDLLRKDYASALQHYGRSLSIVPDFKEGVEGIERVRIETAGMSARAQEQFLEAVRKLPEFRYIEVQWHAANVLHNAPERSEAKSLLDRAVRENARQLVDRGLECERDNKFGAALMQFRGAQKLDPKLPGVAEHIARMMRELQAVNLIEKAEIDMRSAKFDEAREQLATAFELSVAMRGHISELMIQTKRLEGLARYQQARDLEVLGKKSEALAAFEALVKDWPDGLEDEVARVAGLRVDIEGATKEWEAAEAAEAAGELPKALEHYLDAERFYPGWKDGKARIERLRAAIGQTPAAGANSGG